MDIVITLWEFFGKPSGEYIKLSGAFIVLMSWIITNTISKRLSESRSKLARASNEDNLRQRIESLRRGYREIKSTLSRIDNMISEKNPDSIFSKFPHLLVNRKDHLNTYSLLTTAESHFFEHEDLQEIISSTSSLRTIADLPRKLIKKFEAVLISAENSLQQYNNILMKWDSEKKKIIKMIEEEQTFSLDPYQNATCEFIKSGGPLQIESQKYREKLILFRGEVLNYLSKKLNRLIKINKVWEFASWFLYTIGTILVILGEYLKTK